MTPEILILAAGSSSRMRGGDKLLEIIDGQAQLARVAELALETGCPVTIALPPRNPARRNALRGLPVRMLTVPNPQDGMAESLKAGIASLPAAAPVLLLLADLPDLGSEDLAQFLQIWAQNPDLICRGADQDGAPGHPVGLPAWTREALMQLQGDQGAREVLARHKDRLLLVPLAGHHATTDLDTPEDWAEWRARRKP